MPFNNSSVAALASQFINFQWLPRNIASPNAAQSTIYRLELFEIRPEGRNPNDLVQSTQPIYTSETSLSSLNYTIADPALEVGMHYAWRVRAIEGSGLDRIRNNGYSEVYSFTYGGDVANQPGSKVENFKVEAVASSRAHLTWDASTDFDGYKTQYRKNGGNYLWIEDQTVKNTFDVFKLVAEETYEFRVQGRKGNIWGGFSESKILKMPAPMDIKCGDIYSAKSITNRVPVDELQPLQEVDAGGFIMTVLEANAENGRFTGKGFMVVPLFENAKIRCTFTNILVNTDYQLVEGTIPLITDWKNNAIWDIDQEFEGTKTQVNNGTTHVSLILDDVVISGKQSLMLDTASRNLNVITHDGDTLRYDVTDQINNTYTTNFTVEDQERNVYSVDKKTGEVTSLGKSTGNVPDFGDAGSGSIQTDRAVVTFSAIANETQYALDIRNPEYAKSNFFYNEYQTLENPGSTPYDVPYKFIPVGTSDVVKATVTLAPKQKGIAAIEPKNIRYITGTGTVLKKEATGTENEYRLTLPSGEDKDGLEIYAIYPKRWHPDQWDIMGKIIVLSCTAKQLRVILVPVKPTPASPDWNGDAETVKAELDKIYKPVGIDWQVSMDESFIYSTDSLNVKGSGLFNMYTSGMRKLNNAFKQSKETNFVQNAVYLFILNTRANDDKTCDGDMPRSKQFGYIFTDEATPTTAVYRTMAHELGHGVFHLSHTFDNKYQIPEKSTENLMDYKGGTYLAKHQWDGIHDPGLVIGIFESDEDAMQ